MAAWFSLGVALMLTADDAARLVVERVSLESVLADITYAAKSGRRSWLFNWLPEDIKAELQRRGFKLVMGIGKYVEVRW